MATFTWTATSSGGLTAWETPAAWFESTEPTNPTLASFTTGAGNDYVIDITDPYTIIDIGAGGTGTPDIANSLTLSDVQGNLLLNDGGGALDVFTTLALNSLLNLGTAVGGSVLSMGIAGGAGGTISLGSSGRLEGALNDSIQNLGTSATEIIGSGTVIAEGGVFQVGTSVRVASGDTTQFKILPHATLSFADTVAGGTIVFTINSGSGVLDVGALANFNATLKNPSVGTSANDATSFIDFLNVGTNATATLSNVVTASGSTTATLTVFTNSGSQTIPIVSNWTSANLNVNYVSDGVGGTNVFLTDAPCYAAGTAILTPDGEVAVETIQPGDTVTTSVAGHLVARTVIWAGVREIELSHHPDPEQVAPIRFRAGALGDGLPRRDLLLSPDHCLFLDGGLVPAKLLLNGMTIVRDLNRCSVCYHHIELERHALLVAEGVPAESYLDTGNRAYFSNAGLATLLHPELGLNEHLRCWSTDACAPLLTQPETMRPIWDRIAARAIALGFEPFAIPTTREPGIHLMVDGRQLRPLAASGGSVTFLLPEAARAVRLMSRSTIPRDHRPWLDDPRVLGVAVRWFVLRDRTGETVLDADHPALTDGWHPPEHAADGAPWRWTDGDAGLPITADGPCLLEIAVGGDMLYLTACPRWPSEGSPAG
jgi:hypothetical protein